MSKENNNEETTKNEEVKFYTESELQEIESREQSDNTEVEKKEDNVFNVDDFKENNEDVSVDTTNSETSDNNNEPGVTNQSSEEAQPQLEFANDTIKQLNEWVENNPGVDIQKAIEWQNTDVENVDEEDLIVEAIRSENPNVSDEYLNMKMEEYEVLFMSEDEIKAKIDDPNDPFTKKDWSKLYMESEQLINKGRESLTQKKESFGIDLNSRSGVSEETMNKYQESVSNSMKDYKEQLFKIGDTEISYKVDEAIRKQVEDVMKTPESLWNKYIDDKGNVDFNNLRSDMLWLANKDQISKVILDQSKNAGKLEMIKNEKNIDFKKTTANTTEGSSSKQALYKAWKQATQG